jgi:hypothetical protein
MKERFSLARIALPYCVQRQADGSYILLNRNYKPLGFANREHVRYEDYPIRFRFRRLLSKTKNKIHEGTDHEQIYLYSDGTRPWSSKKNMKEYLQRLESLMSLLVEEA